MAEQKKPGRRVSDIVRRKVNVSPPKRAVKKEAEAPEPVKEEMQVFFAPQIREMRIDEGPPPKEEEEISKQFVRRKHSRRGLRVGAIVITVIILLGAGAWFLLPKAVVTLTMKKSLVTLSETVVVAADILLHNVPSAVMVPGEALEARANLTLPFTAQNTETVSARATGVLTVYNSYSSAPQSLVTNTRFESPDKKIFRLTRQVIVPGAKVENGKVTPSSIEVSVTADEAGETYNLPASSGWRIPGFAGRPQYEGFYAEAKQGMKGGFIGERAKPSAAELANARAKLLDGLTDALQGQFLIILSDRFTALPGSRRVTLVAEDVSPDAEDTHTFHLFGEAVMKQIVFEEPTLKDALIAKASASLPKELAVKEFSYTLGTSTVDFTKNTLSIPVTGEGIFTEIFDADAFRAEMAGKREEELKAAVFAIPGVETATVSLSPFFVRSVPTDVDKIEVIVE
ncbi:MAG: hypothetical protein V1885_03425 [Candidatus Brennerbacteria bacterium]